MKVFIIISVIFIILFLIAILGTLLRLEGKQDDTNQYLTYFEEQRIKEKLGDSEQPHISIN